MVQTVSNTASAPQLQSSFLRAPDVARQLGISVPTVWRWARLGVLPKPVRLGPGVTAWAVGDIDAWLAEKAAASATVPPTSPPAAPVAAAPSRQPRKPKPASVLVADTTVLCEELA